MKKALGKTAYILLITVLICAFLYSGWQLVDYFTKSVKTEKAYDGLSDIMHQAQPTEEVEAPDFDWSLLDRMPVEALVEMPESPYVTVVDEETGKVTVMLPEFQELFAINPDIVGWISIDDTEIDYPVMQRCEEKDYYLHRDFYGKKEARGCIYVDEKCDVFAPSDNVLIYGHRMLDGSMFDDLFNYSKKEFWEAHPFIQFNTLRRRQTYQIICVVKTTASVGLGFPYNQFVDAFEDAEWDEYWNNCRQNAYYDTGLELEYDDKIITLSTCEYSQHNGRLLVIAKRID